MAGLLDVLAGNGTTDQNDQLMGLAAGLLSANGSQGLSAGLLGMQNARTQSLQRQDMAQQIKLRDLQAQMMQRKQDMLSSLLGDATGSGPATQSPPANSGNPAIPESPGGPLGSGTFGMSIGGQAGSAPASVQPQKVGLIAQARQLGIPETAIAADLALNEGKGIADMIYKRGAPDMQVANGFAYDKNKLGPGFMPSLSTSQSGQTSMTRIGPDGLPVVSAPQGAVDTFAGYKNAEKQAENANTLLPLGYVNSGTGRPIGGTIGGYLANQPAAQSSPLRNQGGGILTPDLQAAINADAAKNGGPAPTVNLTAPGMRNPVFGLQQSAPNSLVGASGQLQSPAEAKVAEIQATDPAQAAATFNKGRAENMVKYEDSLNGRVAQGSEMNARLQEQLGALDKFKAGGGGETRAQLAQIAQAMNLPDSIVKGVAGGDLSAMQEFNKLAAQTAMEQLKSSMGGAGRISQYEFKVFQNNNPNLSTDPDAIRKIFDFNTKLYNRDLGEQKAFNAHVDAGGNPASFPMLWQQQLSQQGFTNPGMKAQQSASALPSNPDATNLTKGQTYTLPNGKTAVWDGFMFRGK